MATTKKAAPAQKKAAAPRRQKQTIIANDVRVGDKTERGEVTEVTHYGDHHVIISYGDDDPQDLPPETELEVSRLPD